MIACSLNGLGTQFGVLRRVQGLDDRIDAVFTHLQNTREGRLADQYLPLIRRHVVLGDDPPLLTDGVIVILRGPTFAVAADERILCSLVSGVVEPPVEGLHLLLAQRRAFEFSEAVYARWRQRRSPRLASANQR